MGIQINGNTNNINAGIGSLSIEDLNELDIVGVATAANFKTGTSNLHSTGLNIFDLDVDGQTNLDHVSVAGVTTTTGNITIDGLHSGASPRMLNIGSGNNILRIYENSSQAPQIYTQGDLVLTGATTEIRSKSGSNQLEASFHATNGVKLYHNNNEKLFVNNSGVNITGICTATGILETTGSELKITGTEPRLTFTDTDNNPDFQLWANAQRFSIYDSTNSATRIRIDSSGNIGMNTTTASDSTGNCRAYTFARTDANGQVRIIMKNQGTGFGNGAGYHQGIDGSNVFIENRSNGGAIDIATISSNTYASRLRISPEGYVNKPYHPAFCATRVGASHIQLASNPNTDVDFPSKDFDNSNSFNTSNGRFTAPIAGKYYFGVQFYCGFNVTSVRVMHAVWKKNGSNSHEADLFGGIGNFGNASMNHYHPTTNAHVMLELAAGDYVTFNTGTGSFIGSGNTYLYGTKGSRFFGHLVC